MNAPAESAGVFFSEMKALSDKVHFNCIC